jgi:hypothetical protein
MSFHAKSCAASFFLGLSTVMLIYGTGIGSYNSSVCRQRYNYPVERLGYSCRLLGFPTSYVENDAWGHNAHVYPWEFVLNVLIWSAVAYAALVFLRRHLNNVYEAVSAANSATRWAIMLELLVRGISIRPHNGQGIDNAHADRVSSNAVLWLPLFMAAWIIVAIMFVAFIPEVV